MKQFITKAQFVKLSPKSQTLLEKWTIEKGYAVDSELYGYMFDYDENGKSWTSFPCLSIGQMMEFLLDKNQDLHFKVEKGLCDKLWKKLKTYL